MDKWSDIAKLCQQLQKEVIVMGEKEILAVMPLSRYSQLLDNRTTSPSKQRIKDLSEAELLDEINRQIAEWHSYQEKSAIEPPLTDYQQKTEDNSDTFYIEPLEE